jgi:hypothetical protein
LAVRVRPKSDVMTKLTVSQYPWAFISCWKAVKELFNSLKPLDKDAFNSEW